MEDYGMSVKTVDVAEDFVRGGFFLILGNIISIVVSAISVLIVARILGPEEYGLYSISIIVPSLLSLFLRMGINEGTIKQLASFKVSGEERKIANLLIQIISFKFLLGLIVTIVCFAFSGYFAIYFFHRPGMSYYIQISSLLIVLQEIFLILNSFFIGSDKAQFNALITDVQAFFKATISASLVILGLGIFGALAGHVASYVVACSLGFTIFLYKIYKPSKQHHNIRAEFLENLKMLIRYGFPLYLSALLGGFSIQYQNVLLAIFTSNADIGNFNAAMNFTVLIAMFSIPIETLLLPAFSKMEYKEDERKRFFEFSVKYVSMIILPLVTLILIYSKDIVTLIYGESYQTAGYFLSLSMIQYYLIGLGSIVLANFFNGIGKTKLSFRISLMRTATLAFLALLLTWSFKVPGLIIAVLISSILANLYGLSIAKSKFNVEIQAKKTAKIYFASLISTIPILALRRVTFLTSLLQVFLGASVYLASYLIVTPLIGIVTKNELKEVKIILNNIEPLKTLTKPIFYCEEKILSIMSR
ncbi:MAG: flippase [Candidatus Njordarchaeales archaeon]